MAVRGKDGREYDYYQGDFTDSTDSGADKTFLSQESQDKIQGYKDAWNKAYEAGDQAGMDAAHAAAEAIRENAGYSGGSNGGAYNVLAKGDSSSGESSGGGGSFSYESAPSYVSKYQSQIDELAQQILNRDAFSYDPETDPTYQQYKQSYTKNGQRAMQDTLGQVSARTGGLASSYAGSAAQQTYDNYMSALADKIPELRQLAYEMYQDEGNTMLNNLGVLQGLEQSDYNQYLNQLSQYNTDRSFDYGLFSDQRNYDYQLGRDAVSDGQYAQQWAYQLNRDQVSDSRYNDETAYNREQYANETTYNQALQKAQTLAAAGDFSGYKALGYSDAEVQQLKAAYDREQAAAQLASSYYSGSRSSSTGSSTTGSGGQDYDGLFEAAMESGHAKSFIANNYKNYGFTSSSGLYDDYTAWSEEQGQEDADTEGTGSQQEVDWGDIDIQSVSQLGLGSISIQTIERLVENGKLIGYAGPDGKVRVKWADGYNAKNYNKDPDKGLSGLLEKWAWRSK